MITLTDVQAALGNFVDDRITDIKHIDNRRDDSDCRHIFLTKTAKHGRLVVKFYSNRFTSPARIAAWARLSELYRKNGIKTPAFFLSKEETYSTTLKVNGRLYNVWVEEFLEGCSLDDRGLAVEDMDGAFLCQIGALLGKMHQAAYASSTRLPWNSPWVLFDTFCEEDDCDENYYNTLLLYNGLHDTRVDQALLEELWCTYQVKRAQLQRHYALLPNGAVQGDFSTNNLLINSSNQLCGVIDFNLAGNEVFVNEMMQTGIFLGFEAYRQEWLDRERCRYMERRFKQLCQGYLQFYPLSSLEIKHVNTLYNIIRPFRWDKVVITLRKAEQGLIEEVNQRLRWMLYELTRDDIVTKVLGLA